MSNWVEILLANGVDGVAARSQLPDEADVNFTLFSRGIPLPPFVDKKRKDQNEEGAWEQ